MNTLAAVGLKHLKDIFVDNQIGSICMENHEELISRLKFIGHIQKDEKINVRHVNRQPNTIYTKISRSLLYPDNRSNALKFVKDVIARSFEIIEHYNHQGNSLVSRGIVADLLKARQGILNLKYTYNDDTKFCCDMDVVIESIASKITELQGSHPDLFEETEKKE
jgi:hypothetical protein